MHDLRVKVTDRTFMLKFYVTVFRTSLFPKLWWIWFMFGTMIDTGLKFYAVPFTHPIYDLKVKVTDLELLCYKFYVKVFRTSLFLNSMVYLFHVWHDDRYWSQILCSTIPNPVYVKVTDLEFLYCNFLQFQFFLKAFNGFYSFMAWR